MKTVNEQIKELKNINKLIDFVYLKEHITDLQIDTIVKEFRQLQSIRKQNNIRIQKLSSVNLR